MPAAETTRRPPAAPPFKPPTDEVAAKPPFDAIPAPMRTELIPIDDIYRDERVNTRPVETTWVSKKAEDFHPEALGKPIVSRRDDGTIVVIDGQNRIALCRKVGWKGWGADGRIECEVHEGLSLIEEAGLFVQLAGHRSFTAMSKFLARKTQQDPVVLDITAIVERNDYRIDSIPAGDAITAVSTLLKIHANDRRRHPDDPQLTVLNATLATIVHAWQHTPGATDQSVIDGLGMLYLAYGGFIDDELFRRVLSEYPGGPKQLKAEGASARNVVGGTVGKGVAFIAAQAYDAEQRKTSKRLNFT